ncbi:MAG: hemerythrin domain-containing protein [Trebonia sp.]
METESLAAALEREHHDIDQGIAAFTASPGDPHPLVRAARALRRHIYLEEEFLFPPLGEAEPALRAPVFVMLREHARYGPCSTRWNASPAAALVTPCAASWPRIFCTTT